LSILNEATAICEPSDHSIWEQLVSQVFSVPMSLTQDPFTIMQGSFQVWVRQQGGRIKNHTQEEVDTWGIEKQALIMGHSGITHPSVGWLF
jgi:hypothetical protein